jgi:hypothetical protein
MSVFDPKRTFCLCAVLAPFASPCDQGLLFSHATIHESIPASQFNFLCPSLLFAARPFFATLFFREPRLFSSSINEGRGRKNRRRRLRKCTAANKNNGNG